MADYSQSISNTVNVFGMAPSEKWGSMVWGVDDWGQDSDLVTATIKVLTGSFTATDSYSLGFGKNLSDSLSVDTYDLDIFLQDADGYYKVFIKPTTDGEELVITGWTACAKSSTTWTPCDEVSLTFTGTPLLAESGLYLLAEDGEYLFAEAS